MSKKRLDLLLVENDLASSREKAKRLIMAGLVFSAEERLDKPGMRIDANTQLTVKGDDCPYVGRGGLKLEKAIDDFSIRMDDRIVIDVGSSTGGFTDCALQYGAKLSYAIDVGYNQLDWQLRTDDRVVVMERTNFRYVTPDMLTKDLPNIAVIDVSFISLRLILPVLKSLLTPNSDIIALIKPQFEAGKDQVGKGGIIRDFKVHQEVLHKIVDFAQEEKFQFLNLTYSPIVGGKGNIEFLAHFGWKKDSKVKQAININKIVKEAHHKLN